MLFSFHFRFSEMCTDNWNSKKKQNTSKRDKNKWEHNERAIKYESENSINIDEILKNVKHFVQCKNNVRYLGGVINLFVWQTNNIAM